MKNRKKLMINRQMGLDIYRVVAVLSVFLFHSNMHMGCEYGIFTNFVSMGAIFMTAFFMLSGYVLFITYQRMDFTKIGNIKKFYLKRSISILPLYYIVSVLFILFLGTETVKQNLILAPIEILGLQSVFTSIFSVTHNGGTWFISCIILCYLLYPYMQEVVKQISVRSKILMIILSVFIMAWAPLIVYYFNTGEIYSNPFFRMLEFLIGVSLASLKEKMEASWKNRFLMSWKTVLIEFIILFLGVSWGVKKNYFVGNYMMYNWMVLPIFILLIISMSSIDNIKLVYIKQIDFLSERTYAFFLAQFFTWDITRLILYTIELDGNIARIVVTLLVNIILTIVLHDIIEQPIVRRIKKIINTKGEV